MWEQMSWFIVGSVDGLDEMCSGAWGSYPIGRSRVRRNSWRARVPPCGKTAEKARTDLSASRSNPLVIR